MKTHRKTCHQNVPSTPMFRVYEPAAPREGDASLCVPLPAAVTELHNAVGPQALYNTASTSACISSVPSSVRSFRMMCLCRFLSRSSNTSVSRKSARVGTKLKAQSIGEIERWRRPLVCHLSISVAIWASIVRDCEGKGESQARTED